MREAKRTQGGVTVAGARPTSECWRVVLVAVVGWLMLSADWVYTALGGECIDDCEIAIGPEDPDPTYVPFTTSTLTLFCVAGEDWPSTPVVGIWSISYDGEFQELRIGATEEAFYINSAPDIIRIGAAARGENLPGCEDWLSNNAFRFIRRFDFTPTPIPTPTLSPTPSPLPTCSPTQVGHCSVDHYPPHNADDVPIEFILELGGSAYPLAIFPLSGPGPDASIVYIEPGHWQVSGLLYSTTYVLQWICDDSTPGCEIGFFNFFRTTSDPNATPTSSPSPTMTPTLSPTVSPTPTIAPTPTCPPPSVPSEFEGHVSGELYLYHPGETLTLKLVPLSAAGWPTTPTHYSWSASFIEPGFFGEATESFTLPSEGHTELFIDGSAVGPGCPQWSSTAMFRARRFDVPLTPTATPTATPTPRFTPLPTPTTPVPTPAPTSTPKPQPTPLPTPTVGGGDGWVVREVGLRAE